MCMHRRSFVVPFRNIHLALQTSIGECCTRSNMLSALFDYCDCIKVGIDSCGIELCAKGHNFIETIRLTIFGQYKLFNTFVYATETDNTA